MISIIYNYSELKQKILLNLILLFSLNEGEFNELRKSYLSALCIFLGDAAF